MTTGASNDFMQVSRVARQMVERFGFSKKIGQVAVGSSGGNPFLGQQVKQLPFFDHGMQIPLSLSHGMHDVPLLMIYIHFNCRCHPKKITLWRPLILWMQR